MRFRFVGLVQKKEGGFVLKTRDNGSQQVTETDVTQELGEAIQAAQVAARNQVRQQLQRVLREE